MSNLAIRRYIRTAAQDADWIVSVCTGALLLASVGLLEGCEVTTHWAYTCYLEHLGAHYVQKRWTVNGTIVNAAGVSAGIDMALYLVSRLTDEETARRVQWLIHYDPQPPFGGIDYEHMKLLPRLYRGISSLIAPFYTAKARRDILAPIQEKPCIYSATSFSGSTGNQKALGMWVSGLDFLGALQGWNRAARTYQSAKGRRQETVSQRQPGPEPTQVPANSHAYLIRCRCEIHSRASCDFSVVTRAENTPHKIYGEHTSQGKPDG